MKKLSCIDTAIDLIMRGISVIPVKSRDKKPLVAWAEFQTRIASEEEIEAWFKKWPDANIGIVTGKISGLVVVDADGEIGRRWVSENLPPTSVYAKTGRDDGYHCYFRIPNFNEIIPSKNGWKPKVDIKAEGGYVVAPPSVHASGKQYQWHFRQDLNGWDDLAELNPYKLRSSTGNLSAVDFKQVKSQEEKEAELQNAIKGVSEGGRNSTLASLLGKLISIGTDGNDLWAFANLWNARNKPPLPIEEIRATCRSIWNLAKKQQQADPEPEISSTDIEIRGTQTDIFPADCLQPGGLLSEIMEYIEASNAACKPLFALAGAISLVGHLAGQRIVTETGLGTNTYCVSIGYSGAGKNAPHTAISQLLLHSEARVSCLQSDTTSGAALLRCLSLEQNRRALFMFDEFGMLLKGTRNQQNSLADLPKILTRLFSSISRPETKSYGDSKNNITIPWHHLSVYGSSTPTEFWGNLSEGDSTSGFLARLLVFQVLDDPVKPKLSMRQEIPGRILQKINEIWGITPPINTGRGNLAQVPVPFVVRRSAQADKILDEWGDKYWNLAAKTKENPAKCSIFNRAVEHAAKLALIHAAGINAGNVIKKSVEAESVIWATKIVDYCINTMIAGIDNHISESKFHELQQKVLRLVDTLLEAPIRTIYKKLHLPSKAVNEVVHSLEMAGDLIHETRTAANGQLVSWVKSKKGAIKK